MKTTSKLFSVLVLLAVSTPAWSQQLTTKEPIKATFDESLKFRFTSLVFGSYGEFDQGGQRLSSINRFRISKQLSDNLSFRFVLPVDYATGGFDGFNGDTPQSEDVALGDVFVQFNRNMGRIPGGANLGWSGRLYLPTSPFSREAEQVFRYKNGLTLSGNWGKTVSWEFIAEQDIYNQSRTAVLVNDFDEFGFPTSSVVNTKRYSLYYEGSVVAKVRKDLRIGINGYVYDTYYNESAINDTFTPARHEIGVGPTASFDLTDSTGFSLYIWDVVNARNNPQDFLRFKGEDLTIFFVSSIGFN